MFKTNSPNSFEAIPIEVLQILTLANEIGVFELFSRITPLVLKNLEL